MRRKCLLEAYSWKLDLLNGLIVSIPQLLLNFLFFKKKHSIKEKRQSFDESTPNSKAHTRDCLHFMLPTHWPPLHPLPHIIFLKL